MQAPAIARIFNGGGEGGFVGRTADALISCWGPGVFYGKKRGEGRGEEHYDPVGRGKDYSI